MSKVTAIYLDYESEEILKRLREKNPHFNFSGFVNQSLKEQMEKNKLKDLDDLGQSIISKKQLLEDLQSQISAMEGKFKEDLEKKQKQQQEELTYEKSKENYAKRDREISVSLYNGLISEIFETDELTADVYANKYYELPKPKPTIKEFILENGFKLKKEIDQKK